RGLLEGLAQYVRARGPWSIYFRPHGLGEPPPPWLRSWKGDGILARIDDQRMARAVRATGLPAGDLRGRLPGLGLPRLGVANAAPAGPAVEPRRGRGLRPFAFFGLPRGEHPHMDQRCDAFTRLARAAGHDCAVFHQPAGRRPASWEHAQQRLADWVRRLP